MTSDCGAAVPCYRVYLTAWLYRECSRASLFNDSEGISHCILYKLCIVSIWWQLIKDMEFKKYASYEHIYSDGVHKPIQTETYICWSLLIKTNAFEPAIVYIDSSSVSYSLQIMLRFCFIQDAKGNAPTIEACLNGSRKLFMNKISH